MRVPNFKDLELTKYLTEWDREIERMRKDTISAIGANRALLLYSPNKSVWEIKVTDAGALTVTKIAG
jgi:hypothetical protein